MKRLLSPTLTTMLLVLLLGLAPALALAATCDLDGDGDVDRDDISIVLSRRNTTAEPGDPADIDGDGRITVLDARRCVLQCTLPRCAIVTGPTDSDGDGVPDADDQCPGYDDNVDTDNDGVPDGCDQCAGYDDAVDTDGDSVPDGCDVCAGSDDLADADNDGVPDGCDVCSGSNDLLDADQDGVPDGCDECPGFDDGIDADGDTVADGCDVCPGSNDLADADDDGVPDGCDVCAGSDDTADADGDGVPDGCDLCPDANDTTYSDADEDGILDCADPTIGYDIAGVVIGGGSPLAGADVEIGPGSVSTGTGDDGSFSAHVMPTEWVDDGFGGRVFPIQVTAPGFASGYAKVPVVPGQDAYTGVQVILIPVSDGIDDEDVGDGVSDTIEKAGETVGELDIPPGALPEGVTSVTGTVTYIDPTDPEEMAGFPGGDFLAAPEEGGQPVMLESLGLMEFDLRDQNGDPITELAPGKTATVCMKVPDGIPAADGDTIPLWYYDPDTGLWKEDGEGTVEDRDADPDVEDLWICGEVSHFTWWNYDRPVTTHACFKFRMIDEATEEPFTDGRGWYAEGLTYSGTSPERPCACDSDDPAPCPLAAVSSFTVKKSPDQDHPEKIRVYTQFWGTKYYLRYDGDGTYSLTASAADAAVFENPAVQGSCLYDQNVQNCDLLDQQESEPDGELVVGAPNYAPRITGFSVDPDAVGLGQTSALSAVITDPDGDAFSVSWTADCGPDVVPGVSTGGNDDDTFFATFAAPASLPEGFLVRYCRVEVAATDDNGNTGRAWGTVVVYGELAPCEVSGTVYGPDGGPLADAVVTLRSYDEEGGYERTVTTGSDGTYLFDDVPCCDPERVFWFDGELTVEFPYGGVDWSYTEYVGLGCPEGGEEGGPALLTPFPPGPDGLAGYIHRLLAGPEALAAVTPGGSGSCARDIHLPVLWGTLEVGYVGSGDEPCPPGAGTWLLVESQAGEEIGRGQLLGVTPSGFGSALPYSMLVPLGTGWIATACEGSPNGSSDSAQYDLLYRGQLLALDLGDGVFGTITGTVYGENGSPVGSGVTVDLDPWGGTPAASTSTDDGGLYTFSNVPAGWHDVRADNEYGGGWLTAHGQTLTIDIRGTGCTVEGTVYDAYGRPVAGAEVQLDGGTPVTTESEGTFRFTGITTGSHDLDVWWTDGTVEGWAYRDFQVNEAGSAGSTGSTVRVDLQLVTWDMYDECGGLW